MTNKNKRKKTSFTLLELSIALLVITIFLASIPLFSLVVSKARMSSARSLTTASLINNLSGVSLWLETSLETSFNTNEADDGKTISSWYDNSVTTKKNNAIQSNNINKPTYSNTINKLHAVAFDGTSSYFNVDGSFLNNSNYTIFIVEKRQSNKSDNYFIGDSAVNNTNENLLLGYSLDNKAIHSQGGSNSYLSTVSNYSENQGEARIFTFTSDSTIGKKTYINGILSAQSSDTNQLSNISTLAIGKGYQGELGEVLMFNRVLKTSERHDVEEYFSKKWSQTFYPTTSCTTGKVTSGGCDISTCSVSIAGSSTSSVSTGTGSVNCDQNGYAGSASYSCAAGVFTPSSSCGCASGYSPNSGTCQINCNVSVTGVSSPTSVAAGAGSLSCNASNFSSATSISYTCSGGTLATSGSCACNSGYTLNAGSCEASCSVSVVGVTSPASVATGSGTLTCNGSNFSGATINYTCSNGTLTPATNCTCASGYNLNGSSCTIPTAHWVYITSTAFNFRVASYSAPYLFWDAPTATCDASSNQKYLTVNNPTAASHDQPYTASWTVSAYNGSSINLRGWGDCYNCSTGSLLKESSGSNIEIYQCQMY